MSSLPSVLFVSSEVAPFSKTGGLADVSSALPRALAKMGCWVRIITPYYQDVRHTLVRIVNESRGTISGAGRRFAVRFLQQETLPNEPEIIFLQCSELYDRPGFYSDPVSGRDFVDNATRFFALSAAALEYCEIENWTPDIIHAHDWQTGLLPLLCRRMPSNRFDGSRSLLTIHNMAFQGIFDSSAAALIPNGFDLFTLGGPVEFFGNVNYLKAGIEFADSINTVSPSYAHEIRTHRDYGYGLEPVLQARHEHVSGILNGIDVDIWDPETDKLIPTNYNSVRLVHKRENKKALCERIGFGYHPDVPLMVMISRIAQQKGFEILLPVMEDIIGQRIQFFLLGSGDPQVEHEFRELSSRHPDRIGVNFGHNESFAHLLYAGADMFMMPSRFEPCGLSQMMSMRYGVVPVVRATGGLADTVLDADADTIAGTGFSFHEYESDHLLAAVKRAVSTYRDDVRWKRIQRNGMARDFSWDRSASLYLKLFRETMNSPPWRARV